MSDPLLPRNAGLPRLGKFVFLLMVVFVAAASVAWMSRVWRLNGPLAVRTASGADTVVFLDSSLTLETLPALLDSMGFRYDRAELQWAARVLGWRSYRPGRYEVPGGTGYGSFLSKMARGQQDPIQARIIPGQYEAELIPELDTLFQFTALEMLETLEDRELLDSLGLRRSTVVAYLHPDTYTMYWTTTPKGLIIRLKGEMEKKLTDELKAEMQARGLSLDEVLTMASIIQAEALFSDEMARISGLYWNRIRIGMPLQADPTVGYAVGAKRRLFYADYQVDHPYNTYRNPGLPPGPINNPSYRAIEAAVFPERHDYLYMVATPTGRHIFTKTYEEHQRASRQWRQYMREMEEG